MHGEAKKDLTLTLSTNNCLPLHTTHNIYTIYTRGRENQMEKFTDIINSNQLTLVDFFATWCGPCKMMHPVLEQLKSELGDQVRIIKLDVDKNEALANAYRIQSVPTLMLFRKGETLWRQSGAMRLADLKSLIEQHIEKSE